MTGQQQETDYVFLQELQERLIGALKPGAAINQVCEGIVKHVSETRPDLVEHLTKSFGFGTGIPYRESAYALNTKVRRA
jgi:nucleosome binding factor SPN SPT16 subunit